MFVVTLPSSAEQNPEAFAQRAAQAGAQALEIRGDLTPGLTPFRSSLPLLLAPRGCDLSEIAATDQVRWYDLEYGESGTVPPGVSLIRSYHHYDETPTRTELLKIASELAADCPDLVKIVTRVQSAADLLVLTALQRPQQHGVPVCALGMGPLAWPNRILSPWRNPLTYAALDQASEAAPGQLAIDDYGRLTAAGEPELFAVLGGPGLVSSSPAIHNALFRRDRIAAYYGAWPTSALEEDMDALKEFGFSGFSVTAPHKRAIISLLDDLDPRAESLDSVNTCRRVDGCWRGWQKDVDGILGGYPELHGKKRAVIVGSGGVVPAVIEACRHFGIDEVTVAARNAAARERLARRHGVASCSLQDLGALTCDLLVWALPVDLDRLTLPKPEAGAVALDLRYQGALGFLELGASLGYVAQNGLSMLLHQALAQSEIFCGRVPGHDDAAFLHDLLVGHGE